MQNSSPVVEQSGFQRANIIYEIKATQDRRKMLLPQSPTRGFKNVKIVSEDTEVHETIAK